MTLRTLGEIQKAIEQLSSLGRARLREWFEILEHSVQEPAVAYEAHLPSMTVEEYLKFEESSQERHEYINGSLHAMSGVSEQHSIIVGNLFIAMQTHLRAGPCRTHMVDFKLRLQTEHEDVFYYPDIMVACGREGVEKHFLRYPKLIVEVLSPSTQSTDRREKLSKYRQIPTLEEYAYASQDAHEIVMHRREDDWAERWIDGPDAVVEFKSIGLSLPLAQMYEGAVPAVPVRAVREPAVAYDLAGS